MFSLDKRSVIKKEMNTDKYFSFDNELLCFYINSGFVKSINLDEEGNFRINLDYEYILNTDLNEKITDDLSFMGINRLRQALAKQDDFISDCDRYYLKSVGYDSYYDDVSAGVDVSIDYNLFDFWQLLLCTSKQLESIGVPSQKVSNINKKLMRRGFSLRPNNKVKNLDINFRNIEELSDLDIKLEKERLQSKKKALKKELSEVQIRLSLLDRMKK